MTATTATKNSKNDAPPPMTTAATAPPAAATVPTFNLDDLDESLIAKGLKEGSRVTGGFDGPSWAPTLAEQWNSDIKPEALIEKVKKAGTGSTSRQSIAGKLVAAFAWGRRIYFIDVVAKSGVVRVKLPESKLLYRGLNLCELGCLVALKYDGPGKAKQAGRKPPHLYTVASVDKPALTKARADSLTAESIDEREERIAKERAAEGHHDDDEEVSFP